MALAAWLPLTAASDEGTCKQVLPSVPWSGSPHASRACEAVDAAADEELRGCDEPADAVVTVEGRGECTEDVVSAFALTPFLLTSCTKRACVYLPKSGRKRVGPLTVHGFVEGVESASKYGTVLCLLNATRNPLKYKKKQQHDDRANVNAA